MVRNLFHQAASVPSGRFKESQVYIVGAVLIGITLGLLGSGGSILTLPVLVYLLDHDATIAVCESMAIVGMIAAFGVVPYAKAGQVSWKTVLFFGVPGMAGTYVGAWLGIILGKQWQLVIFAIVLLAAAWIMYRKRPVKLSNESDSVDPKKETHSIAQETSDSQKNSVWQLFKIGVEGGIVGIVTGVVGVGGGFLIVPALVLLGGLKMHRAVATSLVIIALKSAIGFWKYQHELSQLKLEVDWKTILIFSVIGIAGSFVGREIGKKINQEKLKRGFSIFLLLMGIFVMYREAPSLWESISQPAEVQQSLEGTAKSE